MDMEKNITPEIKAFRWKLLQPNDPRLFQKAQKVGSCEFGTQDLHDACDFLYRRLEEKHYGAGISSP